MAEKRTVQALRLSNPTVIALLGLITVPARTVLQGTTSDYAMKPGARAPGKQQQLTKKYQNEIQTHQYYGCGAGVFGGRRKCISRDARRVRRPDYLGDRSYDLHFP